MPIEGHGTGAAQVAAAEEDGGARAAVAGGEGAEGGRGGGGWRGGPTAPAGGQGHQGCGEEDAEQVRTHGGSNGKPPWSHAAR